MSTRKSNDRAAVAGIVGIGILWLVSVLLSLAFTAVVIWGIIKVVGALT